MQHFLPSWFSSTFLHFPSLLPILIFIPKIFQRLSPLSVFWFHWSLHSQHNYCLCLASRTFIIIEEKRKTKSACLCGQMLNWALKESTFRKFLAYFVMRCYQRKWDKELIVPMPQPNLNYPMHPIFATPIRTWSFPYHCNTRVDLSLIWTSAEFYFMYQTI